MNLTQREYELTKAISEAEREYLEKIKPLERELNLLRTPSTWDRKDTIKSPQAPGIFGRMAWGMWPF